MSNFASVGHLLFVAFATGVVLLALFGSVGIAALWRLRRHNRLHPRIATGAPLIWLVHPGAPARLHRRLRAAAATASFRLPGQGRRKVPASSVDDLVQSLIAEAAALDEQLVLAGRAPRAVRHRIVRVSTPQVEKIELLAGRLAVIVSATARPGGLPAANAIQAIEDRLDALEVSRQEIIDLEAALHMHVVQEMDPSEG
jgi:hypothetical protein